MELKGKKIFVTGGSGFIGGRLIESLITDHGATVRASMNRIHSGALRVARFPIECEFGSITDFDAMVLATKGCDIIFHLAYGKSGGLQDMRNVTVEGTKALAQAALVNGVAKFVNISTAAVYYKGKDGIVDERSPNGHWGWDYSDSKWDAEQLLFSLHKEKGLPITNVQVAGVYGPWGEVFTLSPLRQLRNGRAVIIDNGQGISNATYVDDVIQALLLAAVRDESIGETFVIKGPGTVTRQELFLSYQKMLGRGELVSLSLPEIKRLRRRENWLAMKNLIPSALSAVVKDDQFRKTVSKSPIGNIVRSARDKFPDALYKRLRREAEKPITEQTGSHGGVGAMPLEIPPLFFVDYLAAKIEYSTSKAESLLGYKPQYPLDKGMALTEQWARWARLIP